MVAKGSGILLFVYFMMNYEVFFIEVYYHFACSLRTRFLADLYLGAAEDQAGISGVGSCF